MTDIRWSDLLSPVHDAGITEAIIRRLGELIGAGVLSAGDRLPPENELAGLFGVAPMTVRNALGALRENGLVETRRGRHAGTYVRADILDALARQGEGRPSAEEFTDFTVWREAVSGEASARAAARMTPAAASELQRLADEVDRPGISVDVYRFADARLHLFIAELADSARLLEAEQQIQAHLTRTLHDLPATPDARRFHAQGHSDLVTAICGGDPERSRDRLRAHVRSTLDLTIGFVFVRTSAIPVIDA